jgi:hypothetical protein
VSFTERIMLAVVMVGIAWGAAFGRRGGPDLLAWIVVIVWTTMIVAAVSYGMWIDRDRG